MPKFAFTSRLAPHTKVSEEQLATEEGLLAFGQNLRALNRRRFLTTLGTISAMAAAGTILPSGQANAQSAAPSITDVLNFALNFEYLEGEFYSYGLNGQSIAANVDNGTFSGASLKLVPTNRTANNPAVTLTGNQLAVVKGLAQDELNHILFLQEAIVTTLGGSPINEPDIDFGASGKVPAITTAAAYFTAARQFTALGNSAYAGAVGDLIGNIPILMGAAQILGAEAQHLGVVNYLCTTLGITPVTDTMIDAQDVPPNGTAHLFTVTPIPNPITATTPPPAVGISRTPQQVLGVVYGVSTPTTTTPAAGTIKGGFFPTGVNGNIVST